MIYFDVTKSAEARHRSGLTRVNARLREELNHDATDVRWPWQFSPRPGDWLFTTELFSETERPGFAAWIDERSCRLGALFHDAIPLKLPHVTWPQSVARHPGYMKLLARFDRIWSVSEASGRDLIDFWQWQGVEHVPTVDVLPLGADFDRQPRVLKPAPRSGRPSLLCVGIVEPRKNQSFLLAVAAALWTEGLAFDLHVVGRVNPHFGAPIAAELKRAAETFPGLHFHEAADDLALADLYAGARATVFPTIAEGCGLPLLESLWRGVPCVCSDLPVLRENAEEGGCVLATVNDRAAWIAALRRVLTDEAAHRALATEAATRRLPTWREAAVMLRHSLV